MVALQSVDTTSTQKLQRKVVDNMTTIDNYYSEIRSDIAKDFGLEAAGYAPRPTYELTLKQAYYLNNKYGFKQALVIANRYIALKMKVGAK